MFHCEELKHPAALSYHEKGGSKLMSILPLDDIPINITKSWTFKPICMPVQYEKRAEEFANFECREDDIWVVTYPKCGTTWTQEMIWMISHDLDYEKSNSVDLLERSRFFEIQGFIPTANEKNLELLNSQPSPRVIKTHLPIGLLPRDIWRKKSKIVYTTRDPKDVVASFYHHLNGVTKYKGEIEEFAEQILTDNMGYSSYWYHVLEFWLIREQPNILFLTYEEMKEDLKTVLEKISKFLQKNYTPEEFDRLEKHLLFDNMKEKPTCNKQNFVKMLQSINELECEEKTSFKFMRKGQVGGYKNELPACYIERFNAKTKLIFEPYGLNMYYDNS